MASAKDVYSAGLDNYPPFIQLGVYEHYKGGLYRVIGMVRNATNDDASDWMVLYISLTYGEMYVRAFSEFTGGTIAGPRFRIIGPAKSSPEKE